MLILARAFTFRSVPQSLSYQTDRSCSSIGFISSRFLSLISYYLIIPLSIYYLSLFSFFFLDSSSSSGFISSRVLMLTSLFIPKHSLFLRRVGLATAKNGRTGMGLSSYRTSSGNGPDWCSSKSGSTLIRPCLTGTLGGLSFFLSYCMSKKSWRI